MDPIWLANITGRGSESLAELDLLEGKWQILLIILYSTTAVISLVSNVITIIVLVKGERLSSELWKYLINLSVADITMSLFCVPFTYTMFMLGRWIFPVWFCPIVQSLQVLSVLISVYTLVIIGIDRYFAIVYPFQRSIYLKSHKKLMLSTIWSVAVVIALIPYFKTRAIPFKYGNETYYDCRETWDEDTDEGKMYTIFIFTVTFALPISILIFVYTSICWYILRHNTPGNPDTVRDLAQWRLKIKVVKMLITIVILFALCWLPIQVFNIMVWFFPPKFTSDLVYNVYVFSYFFCHFLSMSHSFINPFVYGFMSENFKLSLRRLLTRLWFKRKQMDTEMDKLSASHNTQELTRLNSNSI